MKDKELKPIYKLSKGWNTPTLWSWASHKYKKDLETRDDHALHPLMYKDLVIERIPNE